MDKSWNGYKGSVLERENELQGICDEGALYQGTDLSIHKTIKMQN